MAGSKLVVCDHSPSPFLVEVDQPVLLLCDRRVMNLCFGRRGRRRCAFYAMACVGVEAMMCGFNKVNVERINNGRMALGQISTCMLHMDPRQRVLDIVLDL